MSLIMPRRAAVPALLAALGLLSAQAMAMDSDTTIADKNDKALASVPVKVKESLLTESQGHAISDVDRDTIDGRVVYRAKIQRDGKDLKVTVDETGAIVGRNDGDVHDEKLGRLDRDHAKDHVDLTVNDLPAKAKAALMKEAGAHEVVDIDRDTDSGRTVYKARIKQEGLDRRITIDEDGNVIGDRGKDRDERGAKVDRDHDLDRKAKDAKHDADRDVERAKAKAERDIDKTKADAEAKADKAKADAEFAKKTAKGEVTGDAMTIDQVPAAVKSTLMKEANGQQIGDIDRDTEDGRVVYKAKIRVPDGKDRKIKVLEDGSLVSKRD
jgi:uncharacterized membrane protein YkoI